MIKVLLISENSINSLGGIERHCNNIVNLFKDSQSIQVQSISKDNIKFRKILFNKIIYNKKSLKVNIIKSKCDIIHIHGFASFSVWQSIRTALEMKRKIVYTPHYHPFKMLKNELLGRLFFHFLLKPLLTKIDKIICINNDDFTFFSKYNKNTVMMPNWLSEIMEMNKVEKYNKTNVILFVGRNDSNKSPYYLSELPKDKYEIHCVTNNSKGLRDDFIIHKNISDEELIMLYKKASLLVAPSKYEAFSYVVLEALNNKTPVLISDRVRIVDYLKDVGGVTVFSYGNKNDFLQSIEKAINKIVELRKIHEIFSSNKAKSTLTKIYSEIFNNNML